MKGVIFNLFEQFVVTQFGEETWETILERAGHAHATWVGPGTYPDSHLMALATVASETAGLPLETAVRAFGKFLFHGLAKKFPAVVAPYSDARSLLFSIDSVIHIEVNKLMPGSVTPTIRCRDAEGGAIVLEYVSARRLCALMEGLLEGLGEYYRTPVRYESEACMHRGDERCRYRVHLGAASVAA